MRQCCSTRASSTNTNTELHAVNQDHGEPAQTSGQTASASGAPLHFACAGQGGDASETPAGRIHEALACCESNSHRSQQSQQYTIVQDTQEADGTGIHVASHSHNDSAADPDGVAMEDRLHSGIISCIADDVPESFHRRGVLNKDL